MARLSSGPWGRPDADFTGVTAQTVRVVTADSALNLVPVIVRQEDPDQANIQVFQGPDALDRLRVRTDQHETLRDLVPEVDNARNIGTDARRFLRIRAAAVVSGDLIFDDDVCASCRQPLAVGEDVALRVTRRAPDDLGRPLVNTVPVHTTCGRQS